MEESKSRQKEKQVHIARGTMGLGVFTSQKKTKSGAREAAKAVLSPVSQPKQNRPTKQTKEETNKKTNTKPGRPKWLRQSRRKVDDKI